MEVERISTGLSKEIKEFKPWLIKKTADMLQPLNKQGKERVDKVKARLADARETCEKLAEEGIKETERGRAVRKAKATEKLSRHFLKQIDKIDFPGELSYSELKKFHEELEKMFSSVTQERNIWFSRISPLFIIARRRVDFAFSRLGGSISELKNFLSGDYSEAGALEKLLLETDELLRQLDESNWFEQREATLKEQRESLQKNLEAVRTSLATAKSDAKLANLSGVKMEIERLRTRLSHDLRHLEKPFLKFANLKRGTNISLSADEAAKLSEYLDDPFLGLATEKPGYPVFKGLLMKMDRAMNEGQLRLKSSRLRKAQEMIKAVLNKNVLDELYSSCAHAFALNRHLGSSVDLQEARKKVSRLEGKRGDLRRRRKAVEVRLERLKAEREQHLKRLEARRIEIESLVLKVLKRPVNIKL